jgi:hypothetical protein
MKRILLLGLLVIQTASANELSMMTAEGFGFSDATRFSEAQARLMALRAAKIDAQRNLLEVINGVRVTAGTTVKDMTLESDIIGTRVKGMLQGAFETASDVTLQDGNWVASVTMAVCMDKTALECRAKPTLAAITQPSLVVTPEEDRFGVADLPAAAVAVVQTEVAVPVVAMVEATADVEATNADSTVIATVASEGNVALQNSRVTGLILDASALNYTPMLDVRVRTQRGKELYGPGHVPMGSDWLHWAPSLESAQNMEEIIGESPIVIVPEALGEATELVVNDADAIALFTSNTLNQDFLASGKVIIVVSGS